MQFQGIQLFKVGQEEGAAGEAESHECRCSVLSSVFSGQGPSLRNGVTTTVFSLNPQRHSQRLVSIVTLNP